MNSPQKRLAFLDDIRGLAIISVFLFHVLGVAFGHAGLPWGPLFRSFSAPKSFLLLLPLGFGWAGVAIFFVVSGFCVHLSFKRLPDWRDFWTRRFFRIYPPYVLAVLLFALVIPLALRHRWAGMWQMTTHTLLFHNLDSPSFYAINPAFWSIAVEAQLYLLYPFLLFLVSRLGWVRTLTCLLVLETALRGMSGVALGFSGTPLPLWFSGLPFMYWFSWSIGAALADAYLAERELPFAKHWALAWGGAAVFSSFVKPLESFSFMFFALFTATSIAKLLDGRKTSFLLPAFVSEHLKLTGLWSYSIYLLHYPLLYLAPLIAAKLSPSRHPLLILLLCLCLWFPMMALAGFWYHVIELWSIDLGKKVSTALGVRRFGAPGPLVEPADCRDVQIDGAAAILKATKKGALR